MVSAEPVALQMNYSRTTKDEVSPFLFTNLSSLYLQMNINSVDEGGIKILFSLTDGQLWINNVKTARLSNRQNG